MCVLTGITAAECDRSGSAGISTVYLIPFEDLDLSGITWDGTDQATALAVNATKVWTKFEFQSDTAFFNQEKQVVGDNINWVQTLSMNFANNTAAARAALAAMDACCNLVAYVVDNQGKAKLAGILPTASGSSSRKLGLKTGVGSFNSGADPTADQNIRIVTLTCNSPSEAVYTTVAESALDV